MRDIPELKLITFTICPFAQRTRVLLNVKQIEHRVEYIDLENKPRWFLDRVPTGKVPALFVGAETLFESAIINEYLDEISPGSLLPEDPLARAKARAWIALSDTLIFGQYRMMLGKDAEAFETELSSLMHGLAQFAGIAAERAASPDLTLIDAALVPVFSRLELVATVKERVAHHLRATPEIGAWAERLLATPEVKGSVTNDFPAAFFGYFQKRSSHALIAEKEFHHA